MHERFVKVDVLRLVSSANPQQIARSWKPCVGSLLPSRRTTPNCARGYTRPLVALGVGQLVLTKMGPQCHGNMPWSNGASIYSHSIMLYLVPECVARVPVSLWGCGGWAVFARRCATVRNSPQPSAWGPYRAYGKSCKTGHFSSFPASHSVISRGRRGTLWHVNTLHDVTIVVFVWQAQYSCPVFRTCVVFFVSGTSLWRPSMAGAAL